MTLTPLELLCKGHTGFGFQITVLTVSKRGSRRSTTDEALVSSPFAFPTDLSPPSRSQKIMTMSFRTYNGMAPKGRSATALPTRFTAVDLS